VLVRRAYLCVCYGWHCGILWQRIGKHAGANQRGYRSSADYILPYRRAYISQNSLTPFQRDRRMP
jgi:hypothetical protein